MAIKSFLQNLPARQKMIFGIFLIVLVIASGFMALNAIRFSPKADVLTSEPSWMTQITDDYQVRQDSPQIWGDNIIWVDGSGGTSSAFDVFGYNIQNKVPTNLTANPKKRSAPKIQGNSVVWVDLDHSPSDAESNSVTIYDLSSKTPRQISNLAHPYSADIYDNYLVYLEYTTTPTNTVVTSKVHLYNLTTSTDKNISGEAKAGFGYDIYGNKIIWEDDSDNLIWANKLWSRIDLYDISANSNTMISQGSTPSPISFNPIIGSNYAAWQQYFTPIETLDYPRHYNIMTYNLGSQQRRLIDQSTVWDYSYANVPFAIYGSQLVWTGYTFPYDYNKPSNNPKIATCLWSTDLNTWNRKIISRPLDRVYNVSLYSGKVVFSNWYNQVNGERTSPAPLDIYLIDTASVPTRNLSKIAFEPDLGYALLPQYVQVNAPKALPIYAEDSLGWPMNVSSDTVINLNSNSPTGSFSLSSTDWVNITQATIPSGSNTVTVYYKDSNTGIFNLTALENPSQGWADGTLEISINGENVRGYTQIFNYGWNTISFPATPLDPDPPAVFKTTPTLLDNKLFRYSTKTLEYINYSEFGGDFGSINTKDGYWFNCIFKQCLVTYQGTETSQNIIPLPDAGWHIVGSNVSGKWMISPDTPSCPNWPPYPPFLSDDVRVKNTQTGEIKSFTGAWLSGWVQNPLFTYNQTYMEYDTVGVDCIDKKMGLEPWRGYWFNTLVPNLELIVGK